MEIYKVFTSGSSYIVVHPDEKRCVPVFGGRPQRECNLQSFIAHSNTAWTRVQPAPSHIIDIATPNFRRS